jgi:hypothetical protein
MVQKGLLPPQAYLPTFGQNNPAMQMPMQPGQGAPNLPPGSAVNPSPQPGGDQTGAEPPAPTSQPAEAVQGKQLLGSIPLNK